MTLQIMGSLYNKLRCTHLGFLGGFFGFAIFVRVPLQGFTPVPFLDLILCSILRAHAALSWLGEKYLLLEFKQL